MQIEFRDSAQGNKCVLSIFIGNDTSFTLLLEISIAMCPIMVAIQRIFAYIFHCEIGQCFVEMRAHFQFKYKLIFRSFFFLFLFSFKLSI